MTTVFIRGGNRVFRGDFWLSTRNGGKDPFGCGAFIFQEDMQPQRLTIRIKNSSSVVLEGEEINDFALQLEQGNDDLSLDSADAERMLIFLRAMRLGKSH